MVCHCFPGCAVVAYSNDCHPLPRGKKTRKAPSKANWQVSSISLTFQIFVTPNCFFCQHLVAIWSIFVLFLYPLILYNFLLFIHPYPWKLAHFFCHTLNLDFLTLSLLLLSLWHVRPCWSSLSLSTEQKLHSRYLMFPFLPPDCVSSNPILV